MVYERYSSERGGKKREINATPKRTLKKKEKRNVEWLLEKKSRKQTSPAPKQQKKYNYNNSWKKEKKIILSRCTEAGTNKMEGEKNRQHTHTPRRRRRKEIHVVPPFLITQKKKTYIPKSYPTCPCPCACIDSRSSEDATSIPFTPGTPTSTSPDQPKSNGSPNTTLVGSLHCCCCCCPGPSPCRECECDECEYSAYPSSSPWWPE